jgi:hypothetical protein
MKTKILLVSIAILFSLIVQGQSVGLNPSNLQLPKSAAAPTTCTSANYGRMYTSTTDNKSYVCQVSGWVPIETSVFGTILGIPINAFNNYDGLAVANLVNTSTAANSFAIRGTTSAASNGIGVYGQTLGTPTTATQLSYGAYGQNLSTNANGFGVHGKHNGSGLGIYAQTNSGIGVEGKTTLGSGKGVSGETVSGTGILGQVTSTGTAGYFTAMSNGIAGQFQAGGGTSARALYSIGAIRFSGISEGANKYLRSDANGLATWQSGLREEVLSIPATAFKPNNSGHLVIYNSVASVLILASGSSVAQLYANVAIPNGATVTSIRLNYLDNSSTVAINSCILQSHPNGAGAITDLESLTIPTTSSASLQSVTLSSLSRVINNNNGFYRILIEMDDSPFLGLAGVEIKYTYTL